MSGIAFGQELKKLRKRAGISSKVLSKEVGKAVTYVSQLERGLIKKPDFSTSYNLLKLVGIDENKIEDYLVYFSITSPERERAELDWAVQQSEELLNFDWLEQQKEFLKKKNSKLHTFLNYVIEKDLTRAEKLINNLEALISDKDNFDFLSSLFEYDYSRIKLEDKNQLLEIISKFVFKNYEYDDYDELTKKES